MTDHTSIGRIRGLETSQPFRGMTLLTFNLTLLILLTACPNPPAETLCGQGMVLQSDTCACIPNAHPVNNGESCECDTLYHWNEDLTVCILDTTSHDFTWTIDTFGTYYTILRDVEIVDENDIWVVGTIRMLEPDSSGDSTIRKKYNAAHWDGNEWEVMQIVNTAEMHSIFYFASDDIWMCSSFPRHWNGEEWTMYHLQNMGLPVSTEYCWGTSSSNMYFVGSYGSIVHYDGSEFTKIESGTEINLYSVSGTPDGEYVFVCGVSRLYESVVVEINNLSAKTIYEGDSPWSEPVGAPFTVHVLGDTAYFASGLGVWKYNYLTDSSSVVLEAQNYEGISPRQIYVNSPNDIFLCAARSELIHFNGVSWSSDFSVWGQFDYQGVTTEAMDVKGNLVVRVGHCFGGNRALIVKGYR
ncbi:MAG: hypothetical protein U9Q77_09095 [Candidatus Marinimicrobia bacterium]|nr:hypothetical protein [Candidatus Neomarinimicrobiota bacterium]